TALVSGVGFTQVFPSPYSGKTRLSREHSQAMSTLPGPPAPDYFSMEGYVYPSFLAEALRMADAYTPQRVTAALNRLTSLDLGGMFIHVDPATRNGSSYTDLFVLDRSGRLLG